MTKSLYIKNMVCPRCITAVEQTLNELKISFNNVELGQAIVKKDVKINYNELDTKLKSIGFELIYNKDYVIVEQIKALVINLIHHTDNKELSANFSDYLSKEIGHNYSYLSKIFSEIENRTIEKFIILQKIEKVKELIIYKELNFSEIAFELNYSSAAHLSKQFKNVVGVTLSEYKKGSKQNRKTLDKI